MLYQHLGLSILLAPNRQKIVELALTQTSPKDTCFQIGVALVVAGLGICYLSTYIRPTQSTA